MISTTPRTNLEEAILKAVELPVLPVTAQKVLGLMSDPDVSVEKIKKLISADPALATKLLKIANSAFYGGYRNIQNISQAILRLGLNSVRNIVIATSLKNVSKRFGLTEKLLWEQLVGSAVAAGVVARTTRAADADDAFIGGLLHDIGKVILNNEYPEKFSLVMEKVYNDNVSFTHAELDVFEFSHRDVGALVVRKWGFPENIEMLIRHFDDAEAVSSKRWLYDMVSVITLADRICQRFGYGWRKPYGDDVKFGNIPETLSLDEPKMKALLELVEASYKDTVTSY